MNVGKQLVGLALLAALSTGIVWAQGPSQPTSIREVAFGYDNYDYFAAEEGAGQSPSDVQPAEAARGAACGGSCDSGCGGCSAGCEGCGGSCGCGGGVPWKLPQPCCLQRCGITVGGWLQQGITFNGNSPASGINGPLATNDWDGEYQMNQFWLFLDRPADNGGYGWALGGHVDMLFGTDWRFGINHGLENRINGFNYQSYGMVIPQMYMEVALNRLSIKLGHFAGLLDYEVVPAVANPFYSHSYSYGYTVDQLVTGVLCDYKLSDQWSVQGGFTRGWFMFEDLNNHLDLIGGIRWNSPDARTSLAYSITTGPQDVAGEQDRFAYSLVLKQQVTRRLQYILVHNLGVENDVAILGGRDAEWYGVNQYLLYRINPKWSANLRFEWLRDDDGTRVAGPGILSTVFPGVYPDVRAFDGFGFAGDFYEVTLGLNWRPHPNLLLRPECRWDWYEGQAGSIGLPFDDGQSDDQFTFAIDMVVTY